MRAEAGRARAVNELIIGRLPAFARVARLVEVERGQTAIRVVEDVAVEVDPFRSLHQESGVVLVLLDDLVVPDEAILGRDRLDLKLVSPGDDLRDLPVGLVHEDLLLAGEGLAVLEKEHGVLPADVQGRAARSGELRRERGDLALHHRVDPPGIAHLNLDQDADIKRMLIAILVVNRHVVPVVDGQLEACEVVEIHHDLDLENVTFRIRMQLLAIDEHEVIGRVIIIRQRRGGGELGRGGHGHGPPFSSASARST